MTKYQKYFNQMLAQNREVFDSFARIHEAYKLDDSLQGEFNRLGAPALAVIQEWEKRLCSYSEKGNNAKYSANLAEKFWAAVREKFSHIDLVGCE